MSKRSWLRLFWYFVDIYFVKSYTRYLLGTTHRSLKLKDFWRNVVPGLVGSKICNESPRKPNAPEIEIQICSTKGKGTV
jgi:hypothetical protein